MSDPGDHPGVKLFQLTGDVTVDTASLESGFESGAELEGFYTAGGKTFAVFASGYK